MIFAHGDEQWARSMFEHQGQLTDVQSDEGRALSSARLLATRALNDNHS